MKFKKFWKESNIAFVIKHVLVAGLVLTVLIALVILMLNKYTNHGEAIIVPNLQGLYVEEASVILEPDELYPMIIDSVYVKDKPLGTIVEQIPEANSFVKKNRSIFLIVNKRTVNMIPFPDVYDVSVRQAQALIKSLGLNVSGIIYKPSEFKDLVIDVAHDNVRVDAGTRLPEGTAVVLVVGSGLGDAVTIIPYLIGKSYNDARNIIISSLFSIGAVNYDILPNGDEDEYFIYKQNPEPRTQASQGKYIDVWLSKDRTMIDYVNTEEEEFF